MGSKFNIGVSVDYDAWKMCKGKGFAISNICSDALIVASGMPLDCKYGVALKERNEAIETLKLMQELQRAKVNELEAEKKQILDEFIAVARSSPDIILEHNEHQLKYWSNRTKLTLGQLRAIVIQDAADRQKERLIK
jgi:hypothetical protein